MAHSTRCTRVHYAVRTAHCTPYALRIACCAPVRAMHRAGCTLRTAYPRETPPSATPRWRTSLVGIDLEMGLAPNRCLLIHTHTPHKMWALFSRRAGHCSLAPHNIVLPAMVFIWTTSKQFSARWTGNKKK